MENALRILMIAVVIFLSSCNKEEGDPKAGVSGAWQLVQVSQPWVGISVGEDLEYEEKYLFNIDGSFSKSSTRVAPGEKIPLQALGKFTIIPNTHENQLIQLKLVFESQPALAATCGEGAEEVLFVNQGLQLVNASWAPCDGPTFFYERK